MPGAVSGEEIPFGVLGDEGATKQPRKRKEQTMKKLMIGVAAVAMTICAQATSVNWGIGYASNPDTNDDLDSSFTAYVFVDSASLGGSGFTTVSRATMLAALESGSFSATGNLGSDVFDGGEISNRAMSGNFTSGSKDPDTSVVTYNDILTYAVIIGKIDGQDYAYITDAKAVKINELGGSGGSNFGDLDMASRSTGNINNWYAVPEPTSGLLLLLGVAGLALRRRRA